VKTDVFPFTAVLVSCPNTTVTLRSCPSVKRDNVRTYLTFCCSNIVSCLHTVKLHGISMSNPCNICLQCRNTTDFNFVFKITKKLPFCLRIRIRCQITLCPKSCCYPFFICIFCKVCKILYVCRYCRQSFLRAFSFIINAACLAISVLTVSRTISVIWEKISNWHIICKIIVNHLSCRILIRSFYFWIVFDAYCWFRAVQRLNVHSIFRFISRRHSALILCRSCTCVRFISFDCPTLPTFCI